MKRWPMTPRTLLASLRHREEGQSLIELALILPVFFLMTFGFIDICLILFSMGNANFASRAALRYASTHSNTSYFPLTQQTLNNIVAPYIYTYPTNTYSIAVSYFTPGASTSGNSVGSGVFVTFTISYTFNVLGHQYTPISYSSTGCGLVLQ